MYFNEMYYCFSFEGFSFCLIVRGIGNTLSSDKTWFQMHMNSLILALLFFWEIGELRFLEEYKYTHTPLSPYVYGYIHIRVDTYICVCIHMYPDTHIYGYTQEQQSSCVVSCF